MYEVEISQFGDDVYSSKVEFGDKRLKLKLKLESLPRIGESFRFFGDAKVGILMSGQVTDVTHAYTTRGLERYFISISDAPQSHFDAVVSGEKGKLPDCFLLPSHPNF
jgi:hypothetical protein